MKRLAASLALILSLAVLLAGDVRADARATYKPWLDVNDDGVINVQDLMLVATDWGAREDTPPTPDVEIISDTGWWTSDGDFYFMTGELRNNASTAVHNVTMHARFYKGDMLTARADYWTPLAVIPPGEKTCYRVWLGSVSSPLPPEGWDYYELEAKGEYGGGRLPELVMDPVEVRYSLSDFYFFTGILTNIEEQVVGYPSIIMTVYDETDRVVACDEQYLGSELPDGTLGPGESVEVSGGATGRVANSWSVRWQFSGSVVQ